MNNMLDVLFETISIRKGWGFSPEEKSYTCYLFSQGEDKILKKCGEECAEVIIAAKNGSNEDLAAEIADLLYHLLVLCAEKGLSLSDVQAILAERHKKIGNLKPIKSIDKNS